ncbi:hypothetical protein BP6252_08571 [Coleophoma cylindrospora]|uniref:Uncharacterized protein n=1 Tax=Coleophoma cylindrospora TaxID=1849047 RepID=A0A3D8R6I2_9HELO|nr:hypothetical protein BP6252_08571 [Coleophoma cylindrospora]
MSPAQAMPDRVRRLPDAGDQDSCLLYDLLTAYSRNDSKGTDVAMRKLIKEMLNEVMAKTLSEADALIGTHIVFSQTNVINNIKPSLFIVGDFRDSLLYPKGLLQPSRSRVPW